MRAPIIVLISIVAAASAAAHAQSAATAAEVSFDNGRDLMNEGKYAEACAAFEKSQKLDPQIGTRYNIGICSEKQGKLASAWTAYREVAQRDTVEGRRKDAARRADALTPRLTKLLVNSAASPLGFTVRLNGDDATDLLGIETPVDPGSYTIVASASGFQPWTSTVDATGEGITVTVSIPPLERTSARPGEPALSEPGKAMTVIAHLEASPHEPPAPGGSHRKTIAIATGAGGLALVAGGAIAGVMASGKWSDAKDVCGGTLTCADDASAAQANALGDAARTRANLATALIGAGAIAVGIGVALYVTAPTETSRGVAIVPSAGPDGASVTLEGRF